MPEQKDDDNDDAEKQPRLKRNQDSRRLPKMKSGHFLLLYSLFNVCLLSMSTVYIVSTRYLVGRADDALIIPQLLSVIPGETV